MIGMHRMRGTNGKPKVTIWAANRTMCDTIVVNRLVTSLSHINHGGTMWKKIWLCTLI